MQRFFQYIQGMSEKKKMIPGDFCEINNNIDIPLLYLLV